MEEIWTKWEPIQNLSKNYYIESILDTRNGFEILLSDAENIQKKVLVKFPDSVDSYRRTEETFTYLTIDSLAVRYGSDFFHNCAFFKIQNSKYLQWLSEQSYGISEERNFTHFCILAVDSMIDIISNDEPIVTLIND